MTRRARSTSRLFGSQGPAVPGAKPVPPSALCLWKPGVTCGDFGKLLWDAEAAKQVWTAYEARGRNPIAIDVEHNSNKSANPNYDPAKPPEGGGYVELKLRPTPQGPELWLDPILWSDYARSQIESGSRRCISPEWNYDRETNRPVELNRISLVQSPGTYGIGLMASARASGVKTMDPAVMAALRAILSAEDPKAALEAYLTEMEKVEGGPAVDEPMLDPLASDSPIPEDKKEVAKLVASQVRAALASMGIAPAPHQRVQAPAPQAPGVTLTDVEKSVRKILAEEAQKQQYLAMAKASPVYNEHLGNALASLSLPALRTQVNSLPKAPLVPAGTQSAIASAAAPQTQQVQVGQLPANPAADQEQLSAKEQEDISAFRTAAASMTRQRVVDEAHAKMGKAGEDGSFQFSTLSQFGKPTPSADKSKAS